MNESIRLILEKGQETLNDFKTLSAPEIWPLVDQLNYYYEKIKDHVGSENLNQYHHLTIHHIQIIQGLFKNILLDKEKIKNVNYLFSDHLTLRFWDRTFLIINQLLEIIQWVKTTNFIDLSFMNEAIVFKVDGAVRSDLDFQKLKTVVANLARNKVLLTISEIKENKENKENYLIFDFCLIADESNLEFYYFNKLSNDKSISLALPKNYSSYLLDYNSIGEIPDHICLEITSDFEVIYYRSVPRKYQELIHQGVFDGTILHFPFLFNSISIIIPSKGKITFLSEKTNQIVTGRGCFSDATEFLLSSKPKEDEIIYYFDFLDYFVAI